MIKEILNLLKFKSYKIYTIEMEGRFLERYKEFKSIHKIQFAGASRLLIRDSETGTIYPLQLTVKMDRETATALKLTVPCIIKEVKDAKA